MRVTGRTAAAYVAAAVAVGAGAFALGWATAPEATPASAPGAEAPRGVKVRTLGSAMALPALREEEASAAVAEVGGEEAEAEITEAPPVTEAAPPAEEAPESPAPEAAPAPSGGDEVVPEGL